MRTRGDSFWGMTVNEILNTKLEDMYPQLNPDSTSSEYNRSQVNSGPLYNKGTYDPDTGHYVIENNKVDALSDLRYIIGLPRYTNASDITDRIRRLFFR